MKNRIIIIVVLVAIVGAITYRLATNKRTLDAQKEVVKDVDIAVPAATYLLERKTLDNNLIKSGKLIPVKEASIMSTGNGKLNSVNFNLGSYVKKNTVIATIDSRLLQLNLEAAELNKDKASKDLTRFERLLEGEATTESTYQDVKFNFDNASVQIETINKQLQDNRIKAPISGQIVRKDVELGEFVGAGSVLGHIVDISQLKAKVMVSEQDVYSLSVGNKVSVSTDIYPGQEFDGKISFISAQGDAAHNYEVEVTLSNSQKHPLKAGTFAYVNFNRKSLENLLVIPRSALVESLQNPFVYVVENERAVKKTIVIERDLGEFIEISSGLSEGDIIVTSGQINISEGTKINAIQSN